MRILVALTLSALALAGGVSPASAASTTSLCGRGFLDQAQRRCFSPAEVAAAEARLKAPPVRPTAAVWRWAHLRLTRVALRISSEPFDINYLYGRIPEALNGDPSLVLFPPAYVLVQEMTFPLPKRATGLTYAGYWLFYANFRCRKLALEVTSNEPRAIVRRVANGILGSEVCGKATGLAFWLGE